MRWKVKQKEWVEGSIRKRKPFAFLPVRIGDQMIWLEQYQITEGLKSVAVFDEGVAYPELQWVEISRKTLDYYY
jgi:hypothetical protein